MCSARAAAIAAGELIDATVAAAGAGFSGPVAVTRALWAVAVECGVG